jgi:hypothetical protein
MANLVLCTERNRGRHRNIGFYTTMAHQWRVLKTMEAAPEGDSDNYSEESTEYEPDRETDMEDREDAPTVFDPRDVEGGGGGHADENQPTSIKEEDTDNESEEDDETITVGGVYYNVKAKQRRGNDEQHAGDSIQMGEVVEIGDLRRRR